MKFNNVLLMSDLDGTLLTDSKEILKKDMDAIERFRSGGGMFTIATGRGYGMARPVAEKINLDLPAVIFNGAAVYDFKHDKFLWSSELEPAAAEYIKIIIDAFPDIGVEVLKEKTVYVPAMNDIEKMHLTYENIKPVICKIDEIKFEGWLKILTAYPPEKMEALIKFVEEKHFDKVHCVRSEDHFFEMLPLGVNKGSGFRKMIEILGCGEKYIVAAGDYMNDLEMIQTADLGVTVSSAPDIMKESAELVVCDNNHGAVSEIIDYIEKL